MPGWTLLNTFRISVCTNKRGWGGVRNFYFYKWIHNLIILRWMNLGPLGLLYVVTTKWLINCNVICIGMSIYVGLDVFSSRKSCSLTPPPSQRILLLLKMTQKRRVWLYSNADLVFENVISIGEKYFLLISKSLEQQKYGKPLWTKMPIFLY